MIAGFLIFVGFITLVCFLFGWALGAMVLEGNKKRRKQDRQDAREEDEEYRQWLKERDNPDYQEILRRRNRK